MSRPELNLADLPWPVGVTAQLHTSAEHMVPYLAVEIAQRLTRALSVQGRALLRVSGGRSPVALFEALAQQALPWQQVLISLVDERWEDASNERLVRRHLQQGLARHACVLGLRHPAQDVELGAQLAASGQQRLPAADLLLLGMGEDGHCASLFPSSPNLASALAKNAAWVTAQWAPDEPRQRLSLSVPALLAARQRLLIIQGAAKLHTLAAALCAGDVEELPIRALLGAPLEIHWCP